MFCINCFHPHTQVTNSRAKKKQALIWRRRYCPECHTTFTTHETPSLADNLKIHTDTKKQGVFNLGRLILSINEAFSHSPEEAKRHVLGLAKTIESILSTQTKIITTEEIAATTHAVLKRFDELAALQYAARHHLLTSARKRGRPSIVSHE